MSKYEMEIDPHVIDWFENIFMPTWNMKTDIDQKENRFGNIVREKQKTVSLSELQETMKNRSSMLMTTKIIKREYIDELLKCGYIEDMPSLIDLRIKKYYPIKS